MKPEYSYVVADYGATGEGRTVSVLITRAYPKTEDYEVQPSFTDKYEYIPGKLKNSQDERALSEFAERAGGFLARGAQTLTKQEFFKRYGNYVPSFLKNIVESESPDAPGNFNFYSQIHLNFG